MEEQHTPRRERRRCRPCRRPSLRRRTRTRPRAAHRPSRSPASRAPRWCCRPTAPPRPGARGVYDNIEHNTMLRDAGYVELGVDPADPGAEVETPPEGGNGGNGGTATAPVNTVIPAVTQSGSELLCTQGDWTGRADIATATSGRWTGRTCQATVRPTTCRPAMSARTPPAPSPRPTRRLGDSAAVSRRRGGVSYAGGAEPTGASTTAIRRPGVVG